MTSVLFHRAPKRETPTSLALPYYFVHCVRIPFGHPTFVHFQRFYPGSIRMSFTPDFIRFFFLLCARVVRLAFLFLLFRGIKSLKHCLFSPNLTNFFRNICIYQKKALPLQRISRKQGNIPKKFPVLGSKTYELWQEKSYSNHSSH